MIFGKLAEISIIKTLRFNLHYFGIHGFKLPVLVSRNFVLLRMGGDCSIDNFKSGAIRLGFSGVGIFDKRYDRGIWECNGKVQFRGKASLGQGVKVSVSADGSLIVGDNFRVTAKSEIVCFDNIEIGDNVLVSWDSIIMDTDFHQLDDGSRTSPITIEDSVWIGMRSAILKGVNIPFGPVVAAGSTVTKAFDEERCLYGGVNRILKHDISWEI